MVIDQTITDRYAIYNGDCCEVLPTLADSSVDLSIYSPPFATERGGLYNYSSSEKDFSNSRSNAEFFEHYAFLIDQIHRVTKPGRQTAVHCMDVPNSVNAGSGLTDFPGDIIRAHEKAGFIFQSRRFIWKEPLGVRLRTMAKGLAHAQIVKDSTLCDCAGADQLIFFRKKGDNATPVDHPSGLEHYAGERQMPHELLQFKNWKGKQTENRFSHWIWRQYASSFWDDIRIDRVLPYKESKEEDDERHVHPLQLDVIERAVILGSNPGDVVLTPFMGVGSEAYGAIINGRKAIGIELKSSYYKQAVVNLRAGCESSREEGVLF